MAKPKTKSVYFFIPVVLVKKNRDGKNKSHSGGANRNYYGGYDRVFRPSMN